jgi:hypothetical protein
MMGLRVWRPWQEVTIGGNGWRRGSGFGAPAMAFEWAESWGTGAKQKATVLLVMVVVVVVVRVDEEVC